MHDNARTMFSWNYVSCLKILYFWLVFNKQCMIFDYMHLHDTGICEMNTALMVYTCSFGLKTFCDLSGRVAERMKSKQKMD